MPVADPARTPPLTPALTEEQRQEALEMAKAQERHGIILTVPFHKVCAALLDSERRYAEDTQRLRQFVEFVMRPLWGGVAPDGFDIQDKAEQLGLIVKVPADEDFRVEWDADEMFVVAWSPLASGGAGRGPTE